MKFGIFNLLINLTGRVFIVFAELNFRINDPVEVFHHLIYVIVKLVVAVNNVLCDALAMLNNSKR